MIDDLVARRDQQGGATQTAPKPSQRQTREQAPPGHSRPEPAVEFAEEGAQQPAGGAAAGLIEDGPLDRS